MLEYGRQQISEAPADTVADEHWQLLQKLVAQNPVRYGYSSVQFSKENELRYGLYLICPDGTISLICCLQPGDEKPQIPSWKLENHTMYLSMSVRLQHAEESQFKMEPIARQPVCIANRTDMSDNHLLYLDGVEIRSGDRVLVNGRQQGS